MDVSRILFSVLTVSALTACGGGGGGSSVSTGVFIDSAVNGARYETATQSGLTDSNGTFSYLPGETVSFYIGDILLGTATGGGTITPIDFVPGATDQTNPTVINILRFVQSLDDDANPDNGITITSATSTALAGQSLDFTVDSSTFESAFNAISTSLLGSISLVSTIDAQAHFVSSVDFLSPNIGGDFGTLTVSGTDTADFGTSFSLNSSLETGNPATNTFGVIWIASAALNNPGNPQNLPDLTILITWQNGVPGVISIDVDPDEPIDDPDYQYSLVCQVTPSECSKITLDTVARTVTINSLTLAIDQGSLFNSATAPITVSATLTY